MTEELKEYRCKSCGCKAFVYDEDILYEMGWDLRIDKWFCLSCLNEREGTEEE